MAAAPDAGWIMLSKRERKALRELESRLTVDDPKFARTFVAPSRRARRRIRKVLMVIMIVAVALVGAFVLLVTDASAAVFGLTVVAVLAYVTWRAIKNGNVSPPSS